MPLTPRDKAPDFELVDQHGERFSLAASLGRRAAPHLVYFYPRADTPGCTKQSCGLRDIADRVGDTVIVGISPDPPARQARFDIKYGLGFPLLADEDHAVAESYGAWGEKSLYGKKYLGIIRSAFLIDAGGAIAQVWYKVSPKDTPKNLLAVVG
ncbi:MAG: thioredoxin-dependent thiol peroxidase [Acidimicrobiales bacterium]